MNIKNRLFISNILMIFIPFLLIYFIVSCFMLIFTGLDNKNDIHTYAMHFSAVNKFNEYTAKWEGNYSIEKLKTDIDTFNDDYSVVEKRIYIIQDRNIIYPPDAFGEAPVIMLPQSGENLTVEDKTAVYKKTVNGYSIVLVDTNFILYRGQGAPGIDEIYFNYAILAAMAVIIIIILTNRFLTKLVIRNIETSLDILTYGVKQIRDGNLEYRINYKKKDEFASICSDFNEMADKLLDFVNASQKDEANRRELIAGISHDLRTPLTSIKAYVEGLEKGVASTPETRMRYLEIIQNKTDDLTHIVNQLFMFSKLDIGEFPLSIEKLDIGFILNTFIKEEADEYEKKGLSIILEKGPLNVYVEADAVQLRSAFGNILTNSLKYKDKEQGEARVSYYKDETNVVIKFADNGPGLNSEEIGKIFGLFYQSDPSRSGRGKGSGLGLAITAKILEKLGGSIRAESPNSGGLVIVMTLPTVGGDNK